MTPPYSDISLQYDQSNLSSNRKPPVQPNWAAQGVLFFTELPGGNILPQFPECPRC